MAGAVVSISLLWIVTFALIAIWGPSVRQHHKRLAQLDVRVHVNGIRGKSTVTRLVPRCCARAAIVTVAKTTGSAARVIGPIGEEQPIVRYGAATINEQIDIVKEHVTPGVEGLVIECMAVRPIYQEYSQDYIVRSDITVITNVRLDHQEEMGETLEEIADSLALTTPRDGILITAEDRPAPAGPAGRARGRRGSQFMFADPAVVHRRRHEGLRLPPVQGERRHRAGARRHPRHQPGGGDPRHVEERPRRRRRPAAHLRHPRQAGPLGADVRRQRPGERRDDAARPSRPSGPTTPP